MNSVSLVKPAMVVASNEGRLHSSARLRLWKLCDSVLLLLRFFKTRVYRFNFVIRDEVQRLVDREANRIARSPVPRMVVYLVNQSERFMDESMTIRARCVPECCINALGS